jgi:uncharacterized protein (DUF433 family)
MTAKVFDIGTLILRSPDIRGGMPYIQGTGMTVRRIANWYKLGLTPEEILDRIGHPKLALAQIYAALAYYHVNRDEIEVEMAVEESDVRLYEQQHSLFNAPR